MAKLQNVIVIGAKMGTGTSTKSGSPKPYQFANVSYLKIAQSFVNEQHNIEQAGYDIQEISTLFDKVLFERFKTQCPFGQPVHLVLDADPQNPSRNIVVDFELVK